MIRLADERMRHPCVFVCLHVCVYVLRIDSSYTQEGASYLVRIEGEVYRFDCHFLK